MSSAENEKVEWKTNNVDGDEEGGNGENGIDRNKQEVGDPTRACFPEAREPQTATEAPLVCHCRWEYCTRTFDQTDSLIHHIFNDHSRLWMKRSAAASLQNGLIGETDVNPPHVGDSPETAVPHTNEGRDGIDHEGAPGTTHAQLGLDCQWEYCTEKFNQVDHLIHHVLHEHSRVWMKRSAAEALRAGFVIGWDAMTLE